MSMDSSRLSLASLDSSDSWSALAHGERKREKSNSSLAVPDGNPLQWSGDGTRESVKCMNGGKNTRMNRPSDRALNNTPHPLS